MKKNKDLTRPKCEYKGCNNLAHDTGKRRKDGSKCYRRHSEIGYVCGKHHGIKYQIGDWVYKVYRKNYCENKNSILGFSCTYVFPPDMDIEMLLTVDHIDGNHQNNNPSNLQTLCHNCHNYKTIKNGDNLNRY